MHVELVLLSFCVSLTAATPPLTIYKITWYPLIFGTNYLNGSDVFCASGRLQEFNCIWEYENQSAFPDHTTNLTQCVLNLNGLVFPGSATKVKCIVTARHNGVYYLIETSVLIGVLRHTDTSGSTCPWSHDNSTCSYEVGCMNSIIDAEQLITAPPSAIVPLQVCEQRPGYTLKPTKIRIRPFLRPTSGHFSVPCSVWGESPIKFQFAWNGQPIIGHTQTAAYVKESDSYAVAILNPRQMESDLGVLTCTATNKWGSVHQHIIVYRLPQTATGVHIQVLQLNESHVHLPDGRGVLSLNPTNPSNCGAVVWFLGPPDARNWNWTARPLNLIVSQQLTISMDTLLGNSHLSSAGLLVIGVTCCDLSCQYRQFHVAGLTPGSQQPHSGTMTTHTAVDSHNATQPSDFSPGWPNHLLIALLAVSVGFCCLLVTVLCRKNAAGVGVCGGLSRPSSMLANLNCFQWSWRSIKYPKKDIIFVSNDKYGRILRRSRLLIPDGSERSGSISAGPASISLDSSLSDGANSCAQLINYVNIHTAERQSQSETIVTTATVACRSSFGSGLGAAGGSWDIPYNCLELTKQIGTGAFGRVFLGQLRQPDGLRSTSVAVKEVIGSAADSSESAALDQEIQLMQRVGQHPNVVTLIGRSSRPGCSPLLVMEFCSRGSLKTYLTGLRHQLRQQQQEGESVGGQTHQLLLPPEVTGRLAQFVLQIATGMDYLTRKHIIHRDLAARNVLLTGDFLCKISDFGLSRQLPHDDNYYWRVRGVLPLKWMAPEVIEEKKYSSKADVWSFGVLLWEIYSLGQSPYPVFSVEQVMELVRNGYRMRPPAACPPLVCSLMRNCWQYQAKERPDFARILVIVSEQLATPGSAPDNTLTPPLFLSSAEHT